RYLAGAVRGADVACRYGGEEFVILLPKASLADTQRRAEALRDGLRAHQAAAPLRLYPTTMSIGVAAYPEHGSTADALLLAADSAMYRAKALGRDRVVVARDVPGRPIQVSGG
ncbi:MAG: GGDEF domain-containing protein, partial [Candidatus Limnocylindrales bacterium]